MKNNLQWYALACEFNTDKIYNFNIFENDKFKSCVDIALTHYNSYDGFVKEIKQGLFFSFACKSEYELICKGLFANESYKYDIYKQIEPNIEVLAKYILREEGIDYEK